MVAELTEGLVKEIGEWIKFYLEHVTEREWTVEARWKKWDVSYRLSFGEFVHITEHWDNIRLNRSPRVFALHQVGTVLFRLERYEEMESLGIIEDGD